MVVVDSSALIPLARVGKLDLIRESFDTVRTVEGVHREVVVEGKPGSATLEAFLEAVAVEAAPSAADDVAELEGTASTDAAVVLLADSNDDVLLANDRGLIDVARSHDVDCWWVTTLLLHCATDGILDGDEATEALYDLVDRGMNLDPTVYARVQRELRERGERE